MYFFPVVELVTGSVVETTWPTEIVHTNLSMFISRIEEVVVHLRAADTLSDVYCLKVTSTDGGFVAKGY